MPQATATAAAAATITAVDRSSAQAQARDTPTSVVCFGPVRKLGHKRNKPKRNKIEHNNGNGTGNDNSIK